MVDIVDPETRSRMMAGIKGHDTKPELLIRKLLHQKGFRFRLHVRSLPGKPDLAFRRYQAVIFVNGCFWHGHDCRFFRLPATRTEFWKSKISRNQENDAKNLKLLVEAGWRVGVVWECAIRGTKKDFNGISNRLADWLQSESSFLEERG